MIVIRGGHTLTSKGWAVCDVAVADGRVMAIGEDLEGDVVVDAAGCLVGPSFVDLHTHLREPGQTWKEDIASGSKAAAAGGFGALVAMPNTDPPIDTPKVVETVVSRGKEVGLVDVTASGSLTAGRAGTAQADIAAMYETGVRLFTDDGDSVSDSSVLREIMGVVAGLPGAVVAQHAEDPSLSAGGQMHHGELSRALGVAGLPTSAESEFVRRDLELVAASGARYHCQHVSSGATLELIRSAKERGLQVTAEVTPHHLSFDERAVENLHPDFKMYPPLRSSEDRVALIAALRDRTIDVVATDHAPHTEEEKGVAFEDAPRGVIGLETAASAVWETFKDRDLMWDAMSIVPSRIGGLVDHGHTLRPGIVANIVVFDPSTVWTAGPFASKSSNSPYRGRTMIGKVSATIHEGELVYQNGAWR